MTDKELLERARYMVASLRRDSQIFKLDAKEVLAQLDGLLNEGKP